MSRRIEPELLIAATSRATGTFCEDDYYNKYSLKENKKGTGLCPSLQFLVPLCELFYAFFSVSTVISERAPTRTGGPQ